MGYSSALITQLITMGIVAFDSNRGFRDTITHQVYWPIKTINDLVEANGAVVIYANGSRILRGGAAFTTAYARARAALQAGQVMNATGLALQMATVNGVNPLITRKGQIGGALISPVALTHASLGAANIIAIMAVPTTVASVRMTYLPAELDAIPATAALPNWITGSIGFCDTAETFAAGVSHCNSVTHTAADVANANLAFGVGGSWVEGSSPVAVGTTFIPLLAAGALYDHLATKVDHTDKAEVQSRIALGRARVSELVAPSSVVGRWVRFAAFETGVGIIEDATRIRTPAIYVHSTGSPMRNTPLTQMDGAILPTSDGLIDSVGVVRAVLGNATGEQQAAASDPAWSFARLSHLTATSAPMLNVGVHSARELFGPSIALSAYTELGASRASGLLTLADVAAKQIAWLETNWAPADRANLGQQTTLVNGVQTLEATSAYESRVTTLATDRTDLLSIPWHPMHGITPCLDALSVAFFQAMRDPLTSEEGARLNCREYAEYWGSIGWRVAAPWSTTINS